MTEQEKKSLLDKLEKQGVKFLPWIGDKYEEGIYYDEKGELCYGKGKGKKVLVVNECLYKDETEKDAERAVGNAKLSWLVYELIHRFIDDSSNFSLVVNHRPFIQFERALAGRERLTMRERTELWNHLAFYTYVQEPLEDSKSFPTKDQYEKSEDIFSVLMKECVPDVIIVWGKRLYGNLSIKGQQGEDIWTENEYTETWRLFTGNQKRVEVLPIPHPAYIGFVFSNWHQIIMEAVKRLL